VREKVCTDWQSLCDFETNLRPSLKFHAHERLFDQFPDISISESQSVSAREVPFLMPIREYAEGNLVAAHRVRADASRV
jgi:hypothetical protein